MTLEQVLIGKTYIVDNVHIHGTMKQRLEALGMIQGTSIVVLSRKKNGTLIYKMRGTRYAAGKGIAQKVEVIEGDYDV